MQKADLFSSQLVMLVYQLSAGARNPHPVADKTVYLAPKLLETGYFCEGKRIFMN